MSKSTLYIFLAIMIFTITALPITIFASEGENAEINLKIMPEDSLFEIDNMKPGDWAPRSIEVQNRGEMDFRYGVTMQNNGDEKLFNELLLEINDDVNELYNGKLAEFESLPLRELGTGHKEELDVTIRIPEHLGNEFQGLEVHFSLIFTATGEKGGTEEVIIESTVGSDDVRKDGSMLPKTATNMFTFMLIGLALLVCSGIVIIFNKKIKNNQS